MDEAQEIVDAFLLKANCFYRAAPPFLNEIVGVGNTYQHTTIGGVDPDTGEDATNPVTYMILESMGRLLLHDPTISIRIHKNTPDELWERAIEMTKLVGGLPLFQNDEVIVPALVESGFELKDARDYSLIGCQEIVGSGNDYPAPNGTMCKATIHYGVILDLALNNGTNPMNGRSGALKTGYLYDMESFDEVKSGGEGPGGVLPQVVGHHEQPLRAHRDDREPSRRALHLHGGLHGVRQGLRLRWREVQLLRRHGHRSRHGRRLPHHHQVHGLRQEALHRPRALRRLHGRLGGLRAASPEDPERGPPLRQQRPVRGRADEVDLRRLLRRLPRDVQRQSTIYKAGLYGAADHVAQGAHTWATPDGRRTGEPLADAASPAQGRDRHGPTGVFNSELCFDHSHYLDGIALNLRIHPTALRSEEGAAKLRDVTKAYFDGGGMEVQYNVVSSDDMRAAQKDPAAYRDLVVRIAGFSAYFVELSPRMQNDIINRTENVL